MKIIKRNITEATSGVIVQSVNAQGVMGSGVAAALRRKWPQVFNKYKELCDSHENNRSSLLGKVDFVAIKDDLFVANIFGQEFYGNDGKTYANPIALLQGLTSVFMFADLQRLPIHSVKIGTGLGGLSWDKDIQPLFEQLETTYYLTPVTIYEM